MGYKAFKVDNLKNKAKELNPKVAALIGNSKGRIGLMFYDFCGDTDANGDVLNKAIVGQNFKYVYSFRSRIHKPDGTGVGVEGSEVADGSHVFSVR